MLLGPARLACRRRRCLGVGWRGALTLATWGCLLAGGAAAASGPVIEWGRGAAPPEITATAIAAGWSHSCAIEAGTGAVVCWGSNQLGRATPPPSVDGTNGSASAIAAGPWHNCAIQAGTGVIVCWGSHGDLQPPPSSVNGTDGTASAIATGGYDRGDHDVSIFESHACAIQSDTGAVVCWGDNAFGQAAPPPSVDGTAGTATAIAANTLYSCAIQSGTGAVVCWGSYYGRHPTPPPSVDGTNGTASAIATGWRHRCAIQAGTGAVICWGNDNYGEATPPPSVDGTNGSAFAIAAGSGHSCAIQTDTGAVVCWGRNFAGQATPPPPVDGTAGTASAIAAGAFHTLAIAVPEPGKNVLLLTAGVVVAGVARASRRRDASKRIVGIVPDPDTAL
jgi:hypothetical protein